MRPMMGVVKGSDLKKEGLPRHGRERRFLQRKEYVQRSGGGKKLGK